MNIKYYFTKNNVFTIWLRLYWLYRKIKSKIESIMWRIKHKLHMMYLNMLSIIFTLKKDTLKLNLCLYCGKILQKDQRYCCNEHERKYNLSITDLANEIINKLVSKENQQERGR